MFYIPIGTYMMSYIHLLPWTFDVDILYFNWSSFSLLPVLLPYCISFKNNFFQLHADLQEFEKLASQSTRDKVKSVLGLEICKLRTEIAFRTEQAKETTSNAAASSNNPAERKNVGIRSSLTKLTDYGRWFYLYFCDVIFVNYFIDELIIICNSLGPER